MFCWLGCGDADDTERLCQSLDLQQLQQLAEAVSADGLGAAGRAALLQQALKDLIAREEGEARQKEQKKKEAEEALKVRQVVYSRL